MRPQIIETSEFSEGQKEVLANATQFNPVEMVAELIGTGSAVVQSCG